jgi:hypothetical protein
MALGERASPRDRGASPANAGSGFRLRPLRPPLPAPLIASEKRRRRAGSGVANPESSHQVFLPTLPPPSLQCDRGPIFCLKPSPYDVRIYVKDADDFKIVLHRDFFGFTGK